MGGGEDVMCHDMLVVIVSRNVRVSGCACNTITAPHANTFVEEVRPQTFLVSVQDFQGSPRSVSRRELVSTVEIVGLTVCPFLKMRSN